MHLPHRCKLGAGAADRDRADRHYVDESYLTAAIPHVLDAGCVVLRRIGVGHGTNAHVTSGCGSTRAGLDGFGLLAARLPEMHMQVDETGRDDCAAAVEDLAVPV
jgi:hypothetical protein